MIATVARFPDQPRILVVDDDPGIRVLLATCLRRRGFQLIEASNGREALVEMRACHPDLVVLDLMMPEVSGWDVLRERAADAALQGIPIVVVTANNNREVIADVLTKRVCAVLGKPFDLEELMTIVTSCLDHHHPGAVAA